MTKYPEKIGFCFDTCHAFAAGLWNEATFEQFIKHSEEIGYLDSLEVIHINDSKVPFNSRKDRHEKIDRGEIGLKGLIKFLKHERLKNVPFILETPVNAEEEYRDNTLARRIEEVIKRDLFRWSFLSTTEFSETYFED